MNNFFIHDMRQGFPDGERSYELWARFEMLLAAGETEEQTLHFLKKWDKCNKPPLGEDVVRNRVKTLAELSPQDRKRWAYIRSAYVKCRRRYK